MLDTNRIIEVCYQIRSIMKIIKMYRSICILLIIYLSRMISHSPNSFDTILHISLDNRNDYMPRTNGRNLAQRSPSRQALKRAHDCSLTDDEILKLFHLIHVEAIAAGDIITAMLLRLDEETGRVDVEGLVRDKLRRRIRMEMPYFPADKVVTMQARLTELVEDIVGISPLNKDIIFHKFEAYKVELDETVDILRFVARQRTEEGIYEILNNLQLIGELLAVRLRSNDIVVNENTSASMVLRIRRRILDILEFHHDMPSQANSN
ncbi:hypothetical protein PVIIG_04956 [Plasmodium vivax India VII]|uniref:Gametocyte associated protein n=2 Tax=Plasmodium vivax TaxID=5855 RepID=A5K1K7_PLAVS|nr:hypothetical protein, conserved [Plasmodium vivax]EDL47204.1 hypothetical protein, conserved [Plasmodium vivax]KMZ78182.1 hypothetical protein PVIIG_04956 [Plasmodium vivax India VII]|eukprot:XP_001616931.1 hypothetical protein [Plasmodium vivax Sal-1]